MSSASALRCPRGCEPPLHLICMNESGLEGAARRSELLPRCLWRVPAAGRAPSPAAAGAPLHRARLCAQGRAQRRGSRREEDRPRAAAHPRLAGRGPQRPDLSPALRAPHTATKSSSGPASARPGLLTTPWRHPQRALTRPPGTQPPPHPASSPQHTHGLGPTLAANSLTV